jgi:hypothetical protein
MIGLQMKGTVFLIDQMHIGAKERYAFHIQRLDVFVFLLLLMAIIFPYYFSIIGRLRRNWHWQINNRNQRRKNESKKLLNWSFKSEYLSDAKYFLFSLIYHALYLFVWMSSNSHFCAQSWYFLSCWITVANRI